jgi:hypothetical protein
MKQIRTLLLLAALIPGWAQEPALTLASTVDREITGVEKQIVEAAEAMPEEKFNFSPASLNIPGAGYKGVRTFALMVGADRRRTSWAGTVPRT